MIESDKELGTFTMYCDEIGCDHEETFDTDGDWQEMIQQAKDSGWKFTKDDDEWRHICPACAG